MPALPDGAFHISLHRQMDPVWRDPPIAQCGDCESHHDLRPTEQSDGPIRVEGGMRNQCGHDPYIAPPVCCSMVDRDLDVDIETASPSLVTMSAC
jgi:hypothetical protein